VPTLTPIFLTNSSLHVSHSLFISGLLLLGLALTSACAPSHQYLQGRGFYSDVYAEHDLDLAEREGKLTEKGHFSVDASECGIYTPGMADNNIVIPALQKRMLTMGGNAVRHVKAVESPDIALMTILVIGMACGDWTISGDVVFVDRPPTLAPATTE